MNHYPHHIGDFAKKTKGLTLTERGAYRELLDQYYANEKPLPLDRLEIRRMAGAATPAERKAVDHVLEKYFIARDDGFHQKRADEEIAAYHERAQIARENGAKGGRRKNPGGTDWGTKSGGQSGGQSGSGSEPSGVPRANPSGKLAVKRSTFVEGRSKPPTGTPAHAREKVNGGYINSLEKQTLASYAGWMTDDAACVEKAKALGIEARRGESYPQLRSRIMQVEAQRSRA